MGLVNKLLGGYEPSGAFSFEFLSRKKDGSLGRKLFESFFLLPPEGLGTGRGRR